MKYLVIYFLIIASWPCHAGGYKHYSDDDVRENVKKYLGAVFGESAPTLHDYYYYETKHNESEYELELVICKNRWPSDSYEKNIPDECIKWLTERSKNPSNKKSFYYENIRNDIGIQNSSFKVKNIHKPKNTEEPYVIEIEISGGKYKSLTLYHARNEVVADLGFINIITLR